MTSSWRACDACGALWASSPSSGDGPCPLCGDPLAPMDPPPDHPEPELAVTATVDAAEARRRLQAYVAQVRFPAGGLVSENTLGRLTPILVPRWSLELQARGSFRVEAGFDVEVRGTIETWSLGRWVAREGVERRSHWEPRAGRIDRWYEGVVIAARTDEDRLLGSLDPRAASAFPPPEPFDPARHAGRVLVPDRIAEERWPSALEALRVRVSDDVAAACGAGAVRNLEIEVDLDQARFTWVLLPVWITRYLDEEGRQHRLVVHGTTGQVAGPRMASTTAAAAHARTASLLAGGLGVTGLLVGLMGLVIWVLLPVSALCLIGALAAGARALTLPHGVATWNRRQLAEDT